MALVHGNFLLSSAGFCSQRLVHDKSNMTRCSQTWQIVHGKSIMTAHPSFEEGAHLQFAASSTHPLLSVQFTTNCLKIMCTSSRGCYLHTALLSFISPIFLIIDAIIVAFL
eukprot:1149603-Pelagomonas_calceolata.AAC.6